ncbi:hypothetical protein PsorP6_005749 [Peronosclerospora sorghi]|uniref:Uncharacterized protein n=1 Tax=Peronosclerospora sorghi TaxID=230839 RepID=A0ACC0W2M2_9STRA|nr:hypothetical protein PsorP6_005749 [Peronosclerospora sorghi]
MLLGEGVRDGGDWTLLVEGEGAGGEGGVAVSLEALVDEEPNFDWPDHSWMPYPFEHPFGHYHKGFSGVTMDEVIPIERNDRLGLLRRGFSMSKEAARTSYFSRQVGDILISRVECSGMGTLRTLGSSGIQMIKKTSRGFI